MENIVLENQSLNIHWETISLMIKECENKIETTIPQSPVDLNAKLSQNVNQSVEEVKQRVSKLFTKPAGIRQSTLPNIQGIFKKK